MNNKEKIIELNRHTLAEVETFITDEDYHASEDNYGLPPSVRHLIDLPINSDPTYVDVLLLLQEHFKSSSVKYVEIGVSVLKTFYQVGKYLSNSHLYAFDINKINPTVEKLLTPSDSNDNAGLGSVKQYTLGSNKVSYCRGDVFSDADFKTFSQHIGSKVNIVFSDAHHTALGIASEYIKFIGDILDDDYLLIYDDLEDPGMVRVFMDIAKDQHNKNPYSQAMILKLNGWLGEHEHAHTIGIVSSLPLQQIMEAPDFSPQPGLLIVSGQVLVAPSAAHANTAYINLDVL